MNRYCNSEWFDAYKFSAYSEQEDGVYCLPCILFPTQPKNDSRAAKLITKSYANWRKAEDSHLAMLTNASIIRRLTIGLMRFLIQRTTH